MRVLIEFEKKPLQFSNPSEIITCNNIEDVPRCFEKMEEALSRGRYLAGFLSYEAGYAFEECLIRETTFDFPLVMMGVFEKPGSRGIVNRKSLIGVNSKGINLIKEEYFNNINVIKDYIGAGDVYQITYCIKFRFEYEGEPISLYEKLKKDQPVPYPAYIEAPDFQILSLSPELFVKKNSGKVVTKPMKGTWWRGDTLWKDLWVKRRLHKCPKNRAENVMIADLLRNDLGRIGTSIRAPKLFEVDRYKTLCQMTSTVTGDVRRDIPLYDIFKAIHPSGSVTGAPKIRAMQIIRDIETEQRRIYTGAIGYVTPSRDLFFNIPIRTLLVNDGAGEMGVGGGIVWDSTPEGEFNEGMLKAKFLLGLEREAVLERC